MVCVCVGTVVIDREHFGLTADCVKTKPNSILYINTLINTNAEVKWPAV